MIETVFAKNAEETGDLPRGEYASSDLPAELDTRSKYFPDAWIDAFVKEGENVASGAFALHVSQPREFELLNGAVIQDPHIPVDEGKALIINALAEFNSELGQRAKEILYSPDRLNLHEVSVGEGGMMRVRPAGLFMESDDDMRLENSGLPQDFIDDLRARYPDDENINGAQAVIDFDYNGTIGAVVYLAHELGHALADESQINAGYSFRDNPIHMQETQAYLIQNIVLDHLKKHSDPDNAISATRFYTADMTRNLYDMTLSMIAKDTLDTVRSNTTINPAEVFESHFGENWEQFIQEYEPAQRVFDTVSGLQTANNDEAVELLQTLEDELARIHFRPMSIMSGSALASHLWEESLQMRKSIIETVFGGYGPKKIDDALQTAGIGQSGMDDIAKKTIHRSIGYLTQDDIAPKTHLQATEKKGDEWTLEA